MHARRHGRLLPGRRTGGSDAELAVAEPGDEPADFSYAEAAASRIVKLGVTIHRVRVSSSLPLPGGITLSHQCRGAVTILLAIWAISAAASAGADMDAMGQPIQVGTELGEDILARHTAVTAALCQPRHREGAEVTGRRSTQRGSDDQGCSHSMS
jgi:hypothetical protein